MEHFVRKQSKWAAVDAGFCREKTLESMIRLAAVSWPSVVYDLTLDGPCIRVPGEYIKHNKYHTSLSMCIHFSLIFLGVGANHFYFSRTECINIS